jgi:hypothetical protein
VARHDPVLAPRRAAVAAGIVGFGLVRPGMAAILSLPDPEADQVVLTFDISQGVGVASGEAGYNPLLEVTADGHMSARAVPPGAKRVAGSIGPEGLEELLGYIVDEQDFFSIEADEITAEIEKIGAQDGRRLLVADAPTTTVSVGLEDREHIVSLYAVGFAAMLFPEIDALQRLRRIELHLLETAEELRDN